MYSTFGDPSGATGCAYGPQSGTDCVISRFTTPLNVFAIVKSFQTSRWGAQASELDKRQQLTRYHAYRGNDTSRITCGGVIINGWVLLGRGESSCPGSRVPPQGVGRELVRPTATGC